MSTKSLAVEAASKKPITIIGAGLVGSLLAIFLARRGFNVQVFERRSDPRASRATGKVGEGRSINLAISARGLYALSLVDLEDEVLTEAVTMTGRMMHAPSGELTYQAYGQTSKEGINSISRGWLNCLLLDEAEKYKNVDIYFDQKIQIVDLQQKSFTLVETATEKERRIFYDVLIGTDGSASAVRKSLLKQSGLEAGEEELSHGYKEFVMAPQQGGGFRMEKNALHIWPRGNHMMIALPNGEGSYTCTLFLPHRSSEKNPVSFQSLQSREDVETFLRRDFPDFCELVPDFVDQYFNHPTGHMVTLKTAPWSHRGQVLLMGDASHAIVPFFGQGMNAGFEDVVAFNRLLETCETWEELFTQFFARRKANTDAIADMAVENFTEMSSKTADPRFLYQKTLEKKLQDRFPQVYRSRYSMVSFSLIPYSLAAKAGRLQSEVLDELTDKYFPNTEINYDYAYKLIESRLSPVMLEVETYMRGHSWI